MHPIAFVFLGDAGSGEAPQYAVGSAIHEWCGQNPCDFVALLGDNFYDNGVTSVDDPLWFSAFEAPYANIDLPFYAALGNHDYRGNIGAELAYSARSYRWHMPSPYYRVSVGDVDIFVLDTNAYDGVQAHWLRRNLAESTATWQIVYGHHPIRSSGLHGDTPELRSLNRLLKNKGVDAYLAGHDHDLEVFAGSPHFVIAGVGGAELRPITAGEDSLFTASTYGFGYLLMDDSGATLSLVGSDGKVLYTEHWQKTP
jgi:acid phosphatase